MPRAVNIRKIGLRKHYENWRQSHPEAMPWERLEYFLSGGLDEFGKKVSTANLARAAQTSEHTMIKWLVVYKEELASK